ncbi:MAG: DsbA family protein [Gammaproteobacteria bacterium]|nr:DsbA family protein [Gammaproteobacteria bacterium]
MLKTSPNSLLYYIHDPMCSWCWGFSDTYKKLLRQLNSNISVQRLLGGLAPDNELPMPDNIKQLVQRSWRNIEMTIPGKQFNFDFWTQNTPRRSTYLSCRAVISARDQGDKYDELITAAIQDAYYKQAQNPSDLAVLISIAENIGLDTTQFQTSIQSEQTKQILSDEIKLARDLGVDSFPSLILKNKSNCWPIDIDYLNEQTMLETIESLTN